MKKKLGIGIIIIALLGFGVFFLGLFPLVQVNGDMLLYKTFNERVKALMQFEERTRTLAGAEELTKDERWDVERVVLENIIVNKIFEQYSKNNFRDLDLLAEARKRVEEALSSADADVLPRATSELYGWSVDEFKKNVLIPQAVQTVLEEQIVITNGNFEEFIQKQLTESEVKLYFVPWQWQDGELIDR